MNKGKFIVVDGVDGCGKTTLSKRIAEYTGAIITFEPTKTCPPGQVVRQIFAGEYPFCNSNNLINLLRMDRIQHSREMRKHLDDGWNIVCDRYYFSTLVYQTLDAMKELEEKPTASWRMLLNHMHRMFEDMSGDDIIIPDIYFVLHGNVKYFKNRIDVRAEGGAEILDRYEKIKDVEFINELFERLCNKQDLFMGEQISPKCIAHIEADGTADDTWRQVKEVIDMYGCI